MKINSSIQTDKTTAKAALDEMLSRSLQMFEENVALVASCRSTVNTSNFAIVLHHNDFDECSSKVH